MLGNFFGGDSEKDKLQDKVGLLENKVANFEKKLSQIVTNITDQKNSTEKIVRELQNKIDSILEKILSSITETSSTIKVVSKKSSDQKLFVIHNEIETQMTREEIFDAKFTDLKAVSYAVHGNFFREVVKNFQNITLIIGYKNCSEKLDEEILRDKKIEIKIANNETIHDKIYLLSNIEKNLYRVVTGSANFTNAAFNGNNFETIRVDDSKKLYDLYLQRFNFLLQQTTVYDIFEHGQEYFSVANEYNIGMLEANFANEIKSRKKFVDRKTGFEELDKQQVFYSGIYVVGGAPAIGKTTFVWQLLNQLAESGEMCIFYSYETSAFDLILKSMAQENFAFYSPRNKYGFLTAEYIKQNPYDENIKNSIYGFKKKKSNLKIFEMNDETIDELLAQLKKICDELQRQNKKPPIVAIDYLQIIPSEKVGAKTAIDNTVRKLKVFQRATDTTFFVISSFNRENYQSVSFKSFKESGGIEYTADVVWGLSKLKSTEKGVHDSNIKQKKNIEEKQVKLKCLKNRQGKIYDVCFYYYPEHDCFTSVEYFPENNKSDEQSQSDKKPE